MTLLLKMKIKMFKKYLTFIILIRATCKAWTIGCQASTTDAASLADNSASQPLPWNKSQTNKKARSKELFFCLFDSSLRWQVTYNKMEKQKPKVSRNTLILLNLPANISSSVSSFRGEKNTRWTGWTDKATSECSWNHFYFEGLVMHIIVICFVKQKSV